MSGLSWQTDDASDPTEMMRDVPLPKPGRAARDTAGYVVMHPPMGNETDNSASAPGPPLPPKKRQPYVTPQEAHQGTSEGFVPKPERRQPAKPERGCSRESSGYESVRIRPSLEASHVNIEIPGLTLPEAIVSQVPSVEERAPDVIPDNTAWAPEEETAPSDTKCRIEKRRKSRSEINASLLDDATVIRHRLRNGEPRTDLNILVVGLTGVGKSSLINSLEMAIDKTGYHEIAWRGKFGEGGKDSKAAVTLQLRTCDLFSYIKDPKAEERQFKCLPRFWDCPGLPESSSENVGTILRLIINGAVPKNTKMKDLRGMTKGQLERKFFFKRGRRLIHLVLFVHAATDPLPRNLIRDVREAAHQDAQGHRDVAIFGVITKQDVALKEGKTQVDFENLKEELMGELGIPDERVFILSQYCKDVTPNMVRSPEVDDNLCNLWSLLIDPVYSVPAGTKDRNK